jgi:hypothetical protein
MKISDVLSFKEFVHDELKQAKPFYKRIKRLTLYKDNKPIKWNRYINQ